MKAIIQKVYGDPVSSLTVQDVDTPSVGADQALVRIHATAVAGDAWHLLRGWPYAARFATGIRRPKNAIPGLDLAGTVVAVGADVSSLTPGDEVFGWCAGTYAEYASVPVRQLAVKPANICMAEAAAVPIAAFTALQAVRDRGRVEAGQKVLVSGASGGVGSYAVQIAKAYGAEVTAVCSTAKTQLVRSLGADHVIDYTTQDCTDTGVRFDVFLDIYGNPPVRSCRRALKPRGTLVCLGGTGGRWFMGVDRWLRALALGPLLRIRVRPLVHKDSLDDLHTLRTMIEEGKLRPVVGRTFPLRRAAEAIAYQHTGTGEGQVLLLTGDEPPFRGNV